MDIYPTQTKHCSKCNTTKSIDSFHKNKLSTDKLQLHCKSCVKFYKKDYKEKNKESLSVKSKEYYTINKDKRKEYYTINKDKRKEYYTNNKDKQKEYRKEYRKNKLSIDPLYKLTANIRTLICHGIRRNGYTKKSNTYEILGCSFEEFKTHIEKQFLPNMNWENRSLWHLDHIIPISAGKNEQEIIALNHYTNFQPLWAIDNLKKGNTMPLNG